MPPTTSKPTISAEATSSADAIREYESQLDTALKEVAEEREKRIKEERETSLLKFLEKLFPISVP